MPFLPDEDKYIKEMMKELFDEDKVLEDKIIQHILGQLPKKPGHGYTPPLSVPPKPQQVMPNGFKAQFDEKTIASMEEMMRKLQKQANAIPEQNEKGKPDFFSGTVPVEVKSAFKVPQWDEEDDDDTVKSKENEATPENTYWVTKDGRKIHVCDMATIHIFNAIVLLYHKMVHPKYAFRPGHIPNKRKAKVVSGTEKQALKVFFIEIVKPSRETELTDKMLEELAMMQDVVTRKLN